MEGPVNNAVAFKRTLRCSFCFTTREHLRILIVGDVSAICNECVAVCVKQIGEHLASKGEESGAPRAQPSDETSVDASSSTSEGQKAMVTGPS